MIHHIEDEAEAASAREKRSLFNEPPSNPEHDEHEQGPSEEKEFADEVSADFRYNAEGFSSAEAAQRLLRYGRNELPEKHVPKWYLYVSQLWQPMPIMIWIAIVIEAGIQNFIDMAILLFIQFANATIGYSEIVKAGDAVAALKRSI